MIRRHITASVERSLRDFPAVLLNGARQVGKSTLAEQLVHEKVLDEYITLDDLSTLESARRDPDGFLNQYQGTVAIDEIQRVPDLLRALKKKIDENRVPGKFLLTGSANILSYPGVNESLAGRMDIIPLEGLSIGELLGQKKASLFMDDIFSASSMNVLATHYRQKLRHLPKLSQKALRDQVFYGCFPNVITKAQTDFTHRWFNAYQTAYVERDIRDLSRILDVVLFGKLFRLAGLRTANLLNVKNLSLDTGIDQRTTNRYLELLSLTFQANQLMPWYINTSKRLIKTPKIYLNDSGFACHLAAVDSPEDLSHHPMLGALAETWVWGELRKLLVYSTNIQSNFYRTHAGKEVDFVLSKGQQLCGIEFKWADSLSRHDFGGLSDFIETAGKNTKGILLYTGEQIVVFSENLAAFPISCLL